jgi:transcriptional regulatory protein LEU3
LTDRALDQFLLAAAQLQVATCVLIAPSSCIPDANLAKLYSDSCSFIELASELDQEQEICEHGSSNVNFSWNLAAFVILRVAKCHIRESLDLSRGQRCYFSAINLNKKLSVRSDDVASRATMILSQLWTSKRVIKRPDGTVDSLWLRCRNRLGWSVVYDCFWLWREEFGGRPNPYDGADEDRKAAKTNRRAQWTSHGTDSFNLMGIGWSPDSLLQDFQWPIFDEFLYDGWGMTNTDQPSLPT